MGHHSILQAKTFYVRPPCRRERKASPSGRNMADIVAIFSSEGKPPYDRQEKTIFAKIFVAILPLGVTSMAAMAMASASDAIRLGLVSSLNHVPCLAVNRLAYHACPRAANIAFLVVLGSNSLPSPT